MGKFAEHIYTAPGDIAKLEALIPQLPNDAHVELTLDDGSVLLGTVAARPTVQVFQNAVGDEGLNGLVRIEDVALDRPETAGFHDVWLDRIAAIRQLPHA
ncbi:DUF3247 family protein [Lysobacter alkalisoli]|uniref:DUF3247 family protein n=2 Tax=Marilutibacter alkalisoli TaxID=2591633 RepID=A0A514BXD4_9GAMM|nr:DUF3247 family protein [Lysobacter alkalisoli]QDH71659.1 DUF3247 family protein [Lysobacter alkalisoli]